MIKAFRLPDYFIKILFLFLVWRIGLLIGVNLFLDTLPLQNNFLGGGKTLYLSSPLLWGSANFDGEHYLAIAKFGYQPLTYFFFPLYPLLVSFISKFFFTSELGYLYSGLAISHVSTFLSLLGLWKLLRIDFTKEITMTTVLLILSFPTSFFMVSFYTESLFLCIIVWSFYFARKGNWLLSSVIGFFAPVTRVIGIILFPALVCEYLIKRKKITWNFIYLVFIPIGFVLYLIFMYIKTGDAINFFHNIDIYGPQRSSSLVLLPQVFFRYIFRIIPSVGFSYLPVTLVSWVEFLTGICLLLASFYSFKKLRLSYSLYLVGGFVIPSLAGSFSSLPRYAIVLFPAFVITSLLLQKRKKVLWLTTAIFIILSVVFQTMFIRGYWIS